MADKKVICSMHCFQCRYPDCINDEPPSLREIRIIESHNRYVRDTYLTDAERKKRDLKRAEWRRRYNSETVKKKTAEERKKASERTKAWRKRLREGNEV